MRKTLLLALFSFTTVRVQAQIRSIAEYFLSDSLDPDLSLTTCLALKELRMLQQYGLDDGTMVLPTDAAWTRSNDSCRWFKALAASGNSELRQELILEVGATIPGQWEEFREMVLAYPFIDAVSGNVYFVDVQSDPDGPQICLAEWGHGDYEGSDVCADMELPPINDPRLLGGQYIYKINDVILPESLRDRLDEAALGYQCEFDEFPSCGDENDYELETSLRE